ncbi:MAG: hypothetical protein M1834_009209 [Cirrosporium novae-zelandiae]|nr:MAG: hypothetical protein M1834_009209 [Cirrosporium novae-zelandiae]
MPPKKKARILSRAASTPSQVAQPTIEASETTATPNKPTVEEANEELLKDPWTDEEETALFKAMIRWKPVAISEHLQRNGHHPKTSPHTRIPGIWKKLNMLYNLEALDEREDSYPEGSPDDSYTAADFFHPFELPEAEFGRLMFERRLAREPSSSPPYDMDTPIRESTVADTEGPKSLKQSLIQHHPDPLPVGIPEKGPVEARDDRYSNMKQRENRARSQVEQDLRSMETCQCGTPAKLRREMVRNMRIPAQPGILEGQPEGVVVAVAVDEVANGNG